MKIYLIDFSNCPIAEELKQTGCPLILKALAGQHDRDFDVDEASLTKVELNAVRERSARIMRNRGIEPNLDWPIGFDFQSLPIGTIITVQAELKIEDIPKAMIPDDFDEDNHDEPVKAAGENKHSIFPGSR